MGKKKSKGKPAPTRSFEQMMSQAQLNALKPFIEQQVQMQGFMMHQKINRMVLEQLAESQTRTIALEELLFESTDLSREALNERILVVEDKALGYEAVTTPAEAQDLVRIEYKERGEDAEYADKWDKLRINRLNHEVEGRVQTIQELETALLGKNLGEEVEVFLAPEAPEGVELPEDAKGAYILARLVRVSRKPKAEEAKDATASE